METDPSISIGALKIWINGRQFPDLSDYWDGNWIDVTALCEGMGSRIQVTGPFIHLTELQAWREDLKEFESTLKGSVELPAMEPTLNIKIEEEESSRGHLKCIVLITGDHLSEEHRYLFQIDQSYLPGLIAQLGAVLREFPIRGKKTG